MPNLLDAPNVPALLSRMRHADDATRSAFVEALERAVSARDGARFAQRNHAALARVEGSFAAQLRVQFADLGRHVARAAESVGGLTVSESVTSDERRSVEAIVRAADLDRWAKRNLRPIYEEQWLTAGAKSVNVANAELRVGVRLADRLSARIIAIGGRRLGLLDLREDTKTALYRTIAQGKRDQLGPKQIARMIQAQVPAGRFANAGPRYRAQLIARSETLNASRMTTFTVYKDADTVRGLLAHDALIGDDPDCVERDGTEMSFEEAEAAMDETHPQCTLNWSPLVT